MIKKLDPDDLRKSVDTPLFDGISKAAGERGVQCYVIGGWVRDLFLGRPSSDIDILVERDAPELAEDVRRILHCKRPVVVFRRFGTAQLKWRGLEVEFVSARRESYSQDSRKPHVTAGSIIDDLKRRDFTINTIAIALHPDKKGELLDYFDGLDDLEDKLIRTPLADADITFSDDPLRMMRCIRFATQLGFHIDFDTFDAIERNADRISIVSNERICDELQKIIASPRPSVGFVDMQRGGLLQLILPELATLDIRESRGGYIHKNNFYHSLEVLDNIAAKSNNIWLRWAALLHDIGKGPTKSWNPLTGWTFKNHNVVGARMVKTVFRRLRLPTDERMRYVVRLVELHMRPISIAGEGVTDSAVRRLGAEAGEDIDDLMTLAEADITSRNAERKEGFLENFQAVRKRLSDIEEKDRLRYFRPPIDGSEIMEVFGLPPCPKVGKLKTAIKDAVLDGEVPNDHDIALKWLIDKASQDGIYPVTPLPQAGPEKANASVNRETDAAKEEDKRD